LERCDVEKVEEKTKKTLTDTETDITFSRKLNNPLLNDDEEEAKGALGIDRIDFFPAKEN
jgi:hypothetical protein